MQTKNPVQDRSEKSLIWFGVITLFPEMFTALQSGVTGKAIEHKLIQLSLWNPRDYTHDKHQTVDDHPYGGGPGMLMMVKPLKAAIRAAKEAAPSNTSVIYLSPQGRPFNQQLAEELAEKQSVIFIAGRYEGIDERIIKQEVDEEWSIGDYILTGGELAAMTIIDATSRLLPGVLGDPESVEKESLTSGLLKYAQYTRPECIENDYVPDVLLSGHHHQINQWRLKNSLGKTWLRRPDLLAKRKLTIEEDQLLKEFIEDFRKN